MVSRLYCDRCKKEMQLGEQCYVKVGTARLSEVFDGNAEVCKVCAKDIINFVKEMTT